MEATDPFLDLEAPRKPRQEGEWLTPAEFRRMLEAAGKPLRRHNGIVERAEERDEFGDQIDGGGDPGRGEHQQGLGAAGAPGVLHHAAEQQ